MEYARYLEKLNILKQRFQELEESLDDASYGLIEDLVELSEAVYNDLEILNEYYIELHNEHWPLD